MNRRDLLKRTIYAAGISSLPLSIAILQSCQSPEVTDWQSKSLSSEEVKIVENIAEIILPSDPEMPGAKDVHCAKFVDKLIADCLSSKDKNSFIRGLSDLREDYKKATQKSLAGADSGTMVSYIGNLDKSAFNENPSPAQLSYCQLKAMVLLGYFTSEIVMNQQLNYHAIPGEYKGCINISTDERAYVDNNVAG